MDWEPAGDRTYWRQNTLETEHSADRERAGYSREEICTFPTALFLKRPHLCSEWVCLLSKGCPFLSLSFAISFCTWTPTYMCFSWKTCSPSEWFPLYQTWALSNFFDFLQHFRGGFSGLSDSRSICWHILGFLQIGRINSRPFLCIFSVLSHKTALWH